MFRKNDLFIIAGVLLFGLAALAAVRFAGSAPPARVEVRVNGELTAVYPLTQDRDFIVTGFDGGEVRGIISDGTVDVTGADCPDKICVDHRIISKTGESIVCLPNRVVITIAAGDDTAADNALDAVSGR